jgi:hypothetical protein
VKAFASANPSKVKVERTKNTSSLGAEKKTDTPFDLSVVSPDEQIPLA